MWVYSGLRKCPISYTFIREHLEATLDRCCFCFFFFFFRNVNSCTDITGRLQPPKPRLTSFSVFFEAVRRLTLDLVCHPANTLHGLLFGIVKSLPALNLEITCGLHDMSKMQNLPRGDDDKKKERKKKKKSWPIQTFALQFAIDSASGTSDIEAFFFPLLPPLCKGLYPTWRDECSSARDKLPRIDKAARPAPAALRQAAESMWQHYVHRAPTVQKT